MVITILNIHLNQEIDLTLTLGKGGPLSEAVLDLGPRLQ